MVVVESVIKLLLQKLADSLIQEAIFLGGVRDQVEWLNTEFTRMRCFLKDADAKQEGDERVKNWVREVTDVAYDAEDAIDTFVFKVATLRRSGFGGRIRRYAFIFNELIARHEVGSEIERIKNKIRAISESRSTYGIENIGQGAGTTSTSLCLQDWRFTSPLAQETDFVGFDKDLKALVVRLTKGELRRCVVSVVGMGGLGKTTLTKKVYNTESVKKHFDSYSWISVSQGYTARDLLQVIVRCWAVLSDRMVETMTIAEVRNKISEYLKDKKYLVVLDDIWTKEAWDALKDAFPEMNNGSRVVLTTRNRDVALYADARSQPYELRFLKEEESWELFCKKTSPGREICCTQDLERLQREIVAKCHGLPLAIVVIGGILSRKEPWEWENVRKSISWQFVKGEVNIFGILSLSYKDLPCYLKPCFLYLGNFPEDYEFHTKELIQLWAAEGLLEERGEETLEEVGEDYLMQLIQRSTIQVARRNSSGGIKSCRIHDLLRDLSISEGKESKFLQVHSGNANAPSSSRARRLAIHHNDLSKYISLSCSTPNLRSVLIYTQGEAGLQREQEKFLFRGFKLLRVLYLHGVEIVKLPREIGELIHLRYLGCTDTRLKSLPSSIDNLTNLQTLFIASTCCSIKVPSTIGKMQQLRHLQVKGVGRVVIEGHPRLEGISNLQTLSKVKAGKWMEGCLGKLINLRKLGIEVDAEGGAYVEVFYESIVRLDCLHSLRVMALGEQLETPLGERFETLGLLLPPLSHLFKLSKLSLVGKLEKLPDSTEFPTNLTKLTLAESCLKKDPLETLEKLKNLRILRLYSSFRGVEMVCAARGFPRLEYLYLEHLYDLEEWRVEEGAMPCLLHLRINHCRQLKKFPEHVTTLKKLELWEMPEEFEERLREDGGEDWHKIRYIPSIHISYSGDNLSSRTSSRCDS
ncbi:putative disease resistance protein At1g50180 [Magnolia sinica]|uniref:putative disease resistance protein At1g50180 n=1 Tax=Magnolia sinica TaxID=86752 RepID=UPI0026594F1A|nr:putative disease resistance protein At1g50180 [Magnolia sinica]XP_058115322.1 putative disease resistance protein At1g50180 [Magnolia sinica]